MTAATTDRPDTQHETTPAPDPGIYQNVSAEEYHSWRAASKSLLWKLRQSPAHMRAAIERGTKRTDALIFGDAFDCAVFEPADFEHRFVAAGPCEQPVKSGNRKGEPCGKTGLSRVDGQWRCGQHGGSADAQADSEPEATVLSKLDLWAIRRMRESINEHPIAHELLSGKGMNQVSVVWDDPDAGVRCKARIDRFTAYQGFSTHVDLKTARSADPHTFSRDAARLGYHVQAAHYRAGCEALDRLQGREPHHRRFMFLVVEKSQDIGERFRVEVFEPDESMIEAGMAERNRLLAEYAKCEQWQSWPGRQQIIRPMFLPAWAEAEATQGGAQ